MEVIRTVKVKLDVPDQRRDDLHQTADHFRYCANQTSEWAWRGSSDEYCVTNKSKAENALYDRLREETDLTANLVQKGIRRAIEAVKSGVEAWKRGDRTSQPHFDAWSIVYDKRSATFHRDRVSLSTVDGRVECEYVLPDDTEGTPIGDYLLNEDFAFRMSTLQYDRFEDEFYLHTRMKRTTEDGEDERSGSDTHIENPTVLGVDLNVDGHFAVTSTGAFIESADYLNHRRREFEKTRGSLQETGTQSAHLTIQQMSDREHRWIQDVLHSVANNILREARRVDVTRIAFENLTGIRDRMVNAKRFHAWAFRQLYEYSSTKATPKA
jgi:putative transposase